MNRRTAKVIATLTLMMATASTADMIAQSIDRPARPKDAPVTVHVDNGNGLDVRIYAVRNGNIYDRIGTVTSFSSKEFELPRWVTATGALLQLVVVPIGSRLRYAAPPIPVSAGDIVEWKLGYNLANSTISVRTG